MDNRVDLWLWKAFAVMLSDKLQQNRWKAAWTNLSIKWNLKHRRLIRVFDCSNKNLYSHSAYLIWISQMMRCIKLLTIYEFYLNNELESVRHSDESCSVYFFVGQTRGKWNVKSGVSKKWILAWELFLKKFFDLSTLKKNRTIKI